MLDDSAMVEPDAAGVGRLGVIMNLQPSSQAFIDRSYDILKNRLGVPYEVYSHIEYCGDLPEFVAIIASGMKMPAKEIENSYYKYMELSNAVNKNKDDFFETVGELRGFADDGMFDSYDASGAVHHKKELDKDDFFNNFQI